MHIAQAPTRSVELSGPLFSGRALRVLARSYPRGVQLGACTRIAKPSSYLPRTV